MYTFNTNKHIPVLYAFSVLNVMHTGETDLLLGFIQNFIHLISRTSAQDFGRTVCRLLNFKLHWKHSLLSGWSFPSLGLVLLFSRYFFSSESLHRKQFSYSMRPLPYTLYMILVLTLPLYRKFRERDVTIFHVELCIALFCMLIIFVCGINRTAIYGACVAVSALIHYFTLVAVMFMGAEAVLMFQKLVLVFGSTSTKFLVTVSLICWRKCTTAGHLHYKLGINAAISMM